MVYGNYDREFAQYTMNVCFFQEIANSVFRARNGRPKSMGTVAFASDLMMSILVQFLFLAQVNHIHGLLSCFNFYLCFRIGYLDSHLGLT